MQINEIESQHDQLFLKLKILFAGCQEFGSSNTSNSVVQFFINKILFKAYLFVVNLRQMKNKYILLKQKQLNNKKLQNLLNKIGTSVSYGRNMSRIEVNALIAQIKVISPYNNRIKEQQHGVFNNLQTFLDIGKGIRKIHLNKANQLLPKVFDNLTIKSNTISLLEKDLSETSQNYQNIQTEVNKKIYAYQNAIKFHETFFQKFQNDLNDL